MELVLNLLAYVFQSVTSIPIDGNTLTVILAQIATYFDLRKQFHRLERRIERLEDWSFGDDEQKQEVKAKRKGAGK
jgi:hypothetical protein